MQRIQRKNQRLGALKSQRSGFISMWQDVDKFISPQTSRFLSSDRNKVSRSNPAVFSPVPELALRTLSSGMMGGITSPARPWFELRTSDVELNERQDVKVWLDQAKLIMVDILIKSNLYTVLPQTYSDLGAYGTHAMLAMDDEADVVRFYPFPVGSYSLGTSSRGTVNCLFREYQMSVAEIVEEFGIGQCSQSVKSLHASHNYDALVDVVHAVEPNPDADDEKEEIKYKAYTSCYYEASSNEDKFLREEGYDEFPILAPRWYVQGGDAYGTRCPGMIALPYCKGLNAEEKLKLAAINLMVKPPVNVPSSMRNSEVALVPGGVNYSDMQSGNGGVNPAYQVQINLQHLREDIAKLEAGIDQIFFRDLFQMISGIEKTNITAYQISQMMNEKMTLLGPVLERMNDELLDPLINRVWSIMVRKRLIPTPPPELSNMDLSIEYVSIMSQAQKATASVSIEKTLAFASQLLAINPGSKHKYNWDQFADEHATSIGAPIRLLVADEDAQRAAQAEAQQQQQMQMMQMTQAAAQTAQTLSQTQTTQPSMLGPVADAMMGARQ